MLREASEFSSLVFAVLIDVMCDFVFGFVSPLGSWS